MANMEKYDKIEEMLNAANSVGSFWKRFDDKCAEPNCDKHHATFNDDARFSQFDVNVFFSSAIGYWGNSGCTTLPLNVSNKMMKKYLVQYLRENDRKIFTEIAAMIREDALDLIDDAEEEVSQMNEFLDEVKKLRDK